MQIFKIKFLSPYSRMRTLVKLMQGNSSVTSLVKNHHTTTGLRTSSLKK